jgi:hypothetical protein
MNLLAKAFSDLSRPVDGELLAAAWRIASQDVADDLRFIRQYAKVIAERDEWLSTGALVHRPAYVQQCRHWLAETIKRYLRNVRTISETEAAMTDIGMAFAKSSYAWDAA